MKIEVEVIANEVIKPSSPTPEHLRHYQLSFIDQLTPKTYNPLILFYHEHKLPGITAISEHIKNSLSKVLTLYHPLAGRVKNDRFFDCNDDGIAYSEARVALRIADVMENPNPSELAKLLPNQVHELTEFPLSVRLNIFSDGGIGLGICITHQLADASSCITFIKNWTTLSRGEHVEKPQLISANLFPSKDDVGFNPNAGISMAAVSRRFIFEASAIEAIRSKYAKNEDRSEKPIRPTRIEALSTFIWSRFIIANRDELLEGPTEKVYALIHPVNIRQKLDPPLSGESFGNIARFTVTLLPESMSLAYLESDEERYGCDMVREIRESIKKVDMEYVKKVQKGEDSNLEIYKEFGKISPIAIAFTSLCRFPLYEADFGWGEPLWVSSAPLPFKNVVTFMDAKNGSAIEAYVGLKEEHMAKLEADVEFLKYI